MKKAIKFLIFTIALILSAFIGYSADKTDNALLGNIINQTENNINYYDYKRHLYFSPEKKYVKYIGRSVYFNEALWFSMSGSGIEFITSTDSLKISFTTDSLQALSSEHKPRIKITINDEIYFNNVLEEENQDIFLDLSKYVGDKVVKIIKLSESMYSSCGISKISVYDDKDISPTDDRDLKIEFIGDSITAGYGIDEENPYRSFSTETENFSKTYAYLTAEALKADYSTVAFSGYGVLSGQNKTDCIVSKHYEKAITNKVFDSPYPLDKWSFNNFTPDIIVINLGVNDVNYCYTQTRKESFMQKYKELIGLVRWNNKDAHILCVLGEINNSMFPYIEKAVSEYIDDTGDSKVYCDTLDFEMRNYTSAIDGHPSAQSHIAASENLTSMITDIFNNNFISSYEKDKVEAVGLVE